MRCEGALAPVDEDFRVIVIPLRDGTACGLCIRIEQALQLESEARMAVNEATPRGKIPRELPT
jgi:hypothetical protein